MAEHPSATAPHNFATAPDGCRLAYRVHGSAGHGRRVALIHSLAMNGEFWAPVVPLLTAQGDAVLTWDCRGHGASDKPAGPYTVELFARDLAAILDAAGWEEAAVAGASMGGAVALAFAQAYPDRVTGLGLIDTTAWYGPNAPQQWAERADKGIKEGLHGLVDFQKTRWFGDAFRAERHATVQEAIDVFVRNDPMAYAETCRMLGSADLRPGLAGIAVPTVIVVGSEDYATPVAMAEALHRAIAGSVLTVIDGARHLTPLEVPERIAAELGHLPGLSSRSGEV